MTSQNRLHELLEELHRELGAARSVDPATRSMIEHLQQDLRAFATRPPGGAASVEPYTSLGERLKGSVKALEAAHPQLSASIERVIDQLAAWNL